MSLALRALSTVVCWLPAAWTAVLVKLTARLLAGYRARVLDENLKRAFPKHSAAQRRALASRVREHLALTLFEFLRIPRSRREGFSEVEILGETSYLEAKARGRGVLGLSAHLGSFDLCIQAFAAKHPEASFALVVRAFGPAFESLASRLRATDNVRLISASEGLRPILRAVRAGESVVFVLDQHAPRKSGVRVELFGEEASAMAALAVVAMRTKAPVVPAFCHRTEDHQHVMEIRPEIPLERDRGVRETVVHMTQRYTRAIEEAIYEHPEQWFWTHRRFKRD